MAESPAPKKKELPRYRLTEKAYINDRIYDPETQPVDPNSEEGELRPLIITFTGIPGPHMEPVNEAAREMLEKHPCSKMNFDQAFNMMTPPSARA